MPVFVEKASPNFLQYRRLYGLCQAIPNKACARRRAVPEAVSLAQGLCVACFWPAGAVLVCMILPIYSYGHTVLRKKAEDISPDYPNLPGLIADMFETMYNASGVGLAAPQVGLGIRLFVVDAEPMDEEKLAGFKKVFINAQMLEESGHAWAYSEGCLSLPNLHEDVLRKPTIRIRYQDEHFATHEETFEGLAARVIQHEYDHIEGVLFTDHLSGLRKRLLKGKLNAIAKGDCDARYRMKFALR